MRSKLKARMKLIEQQINKRLEQAIARADAAAWQTPTATEIQTAFAAALADFFDAVRRWPTTEGGYPRESLPSKLLAWAELAPVDSAWSAIGALAWRTQRLTLCANLLRTLPLESDAARVLEEITRRDRADELNTIEALHKETNNARNRS